MYLLEGNIGAGKSTFLRLVAQHLPHIQVTFEPVNDWQKDVHGQSLLSNFYQDPKRWAYTLETFAMISRVRDYEHDMKTKRFAHIVERSIYSGHYCFAHNGYEQGFLSDIEWSIYNSWFNFVTAKSVKPPHGFIYLQVDPEVAYARLKKRNRSAESTVPLSYLEQIHRHHEKFLIEKIGILPHLQNVPVLVLDCNQDFEEDPAVLAQHMRRIESFVMLQDGLAKSVETSTSQISL